MAARRNARVWLLAIVVLAATLAAVPEAHACPVCFGENDSPMAKGVNNGILAMLGVVVTVQIGFVALFVSFRRHGQRLEEKLDKDPEIIGAAPKLIDGGSS